MSPSEASGFPERTLRGIRQKRFIEKAPLISGEAFWPNSMSEREDLHLETSVDFEDDPGAAELLRLNPNSLHGIIAFRSEIIERLAADADLMQEQVGQLWLERRPLDDDPYHGNVVFCNTLEKWRLKIIAQEIAHRSRIV